MFINIFLKPDQQILIRITKNVKHNIRTLVMRKIRWLQDSFSRNILVQKCMHKFWTLEESRETYFSQKLITRAIKKYNFY